MQEFTSGFPDFHTEITGLLASENKVAPETTDTIATGANLLASHRQMLGLIFDP